MLALLGETVAAGVYGTYYRIVLAGVGFASWLAPLSLRLLAASETRRTRLLWLERRMAVIALLLAFGLATLGPRVVSLVTHHQVCHPS